MRPGRSTNTILWCFCLLLVVVGGCKWPSLPSSEFVNDFWPYGKSDTKDTAQYGPTPSMRLSDIKKLGENINKRPPQQQQMIVVALAKQIRIERDPLVRVAILDALAGYPLPLAAQVLRAGLQDDSREVKVACCDAWARRGGPDSVAALSGVISNESDVDARLAAARALGKIHEPGVVQALGVALEDRQDPALQYRAVQSLREVTHKDLGDDVAVWRQYVRQPDAPLPQKSTSLAERLIWWR